MLQNITYRGSPYYLANLETNTTGSDHWYKCVIKLVTSDYISEL